MALVVRAANSPEDIRRYIEFAKKVYAGNDYWVETDPEHLTRILGKSAPQSEHSAIQPFMAESAGEIVATVTAVVDDLYNTRWGELTGHLFFFEALAGRQESVKELLGTACKWLEGKGCTTARFGFLFGWQLPLTIDAYDEPPSLFHTYNPAYYHSYVKDCGFATEHGLVEYQIQFGPAAKELYRTNISQAEKNGVRIRPWDFSRLGAETELLTELVNETFREHWGAPEFTLKEMEEMTVEMKDILVPEFLAFASVGEEPAGFVYALPDLNQLRKSSAPRERGAAAAPSSEAKIDHGILLIMGVKSRFRGMGISQALGSHSYLAMMDKGYRSASYTVVLDDNWQSRRTAEKLLGHIARNYVVYSKNLVRR